MKIYVGNLSSVLTEEQLCDAFSDFGEVESASIIADRVSGKPKGFGFVEMLDDKDAVDAIQALDESSLSGQNIKVNKARERTGRRRKVKTSKSHAT